MRDLIDSTEMYLRTVWELEEEGIPALRARLAERLGLSAPSVSEAVARLTDERLLRLDDQRIVRLTDEGRARAVRVMRKHRLAERLLVDVLGVEPEHVHEEACRWEHVISDRVEQRLDEFLGHPATSPYGNPIPGASKTAHRDVVTLADVEVEGDVRVLRLSEQLQGDQETMHRLDVHGLRAGATARVVATGDGVRVEVGDGGIDLDADTARLIYVDAE